MVPPPASSATRRHQPHARRRPRAPGRQAFAGSPRSSLQAVFYQLTADTVEGASPRPTRCSASRRDARRAQDRTPDNLPLVARYRGVPVAVTAIFPRVARRWSRGGERALRDPLTSPTTRLVGDGLAWVRQLARCATRPAARPRCSMASVKSPRRPWPPLLAARAPPDAPARGAPRARRHPLQRLRRWRVRPRREGLSACDARARRPR